jgi:hypothetical protein
MSAVVRPVTRSRDPLTGGNHRGPANHRDEIAVTSRLHPDDAKAVLGVLVGDALSQPSKHLSVGWLWLRLHDAHRTGLVAKTLARGAEVLHPGPPPGNAGSKFAACRRPSGLSECEPTFLGAWNEECHSRRLRGPRTKIRLVSGRCVNCLERISESSPATSVARERDRIRSA